MLSLWTRNSVGVPCPVFFDVWNNTWEYHVQFSSMSEISWSAMSSVPLCPKWQVGVQCPVFLDVRNDKWEYHVQCSSMSETTSLGGGLQGSPIRASGKSSMYTICEDEYGVLVEWYLQEETDVFGGKPAPIPLHTLQISVGMGWNRTRGAAMRCQRLTTLAQPRLNLMCITYIFLFRAEQGKIYFYFKNKLDSNVWERKLYKIHKEHKNELCGQNANFWVLHLEVHEVTTTDVLTWTASSVTRAKYVAFVSNTDDRQLDWKQSHREGLQSVAGWPRTFVAQGCPVRRRPFFKSPRAKEVMATHKDYEFRCSYSHV
jgi:hypothetical protein